MNSTAALLAALAVLALAGAVVYWLGYAFSLGYHRAKREFVARMIKDSCKGEHN